MPKQARRVGLYVWPETTWGEVTGTPAFTRLRYGSENLRFSADERTSAEIRADRMTTRRIRHGLRCEGGFDFELAWGGFDDLLAGALMSDWADDRLANGATRKSFAMEKHFADAGLYQLFTGMAVSRLSLRAATGEMVTGRFDFLGRDAATGPASAGDGSPLEPPSAAAMSAATGVGGIKIDGVAATGVHIQSIRVNVDNGLRGQWAVGGTQMVDMALGTLGVGGQLQAFFDDFSLYDAFLAGSETSLEFTVSDPDAGSYTVLLPRIRHAQAQGPWAAGADRDVVLTLSFEALRDAAEDAMIVITRQAV